MGGGGGGLEQAKLGKGYWVENEEGDGVGEEGDGVGEEGWCAGMNSQKANRRRRTPSLPSSTLHYFLLTCSHSQIPFQHSLVGSTH